MIFVKFLITTRRNFHNVHSKVVQSALLSLAISLSRGSFLGVQPGFYSPGAPVQLALRGIAVFLQLFKLLMSDRSSGGFYQSGVNGNSFIDDQPLCFELL